MDFLQYTFVPTIHALFYQAVRYTEEQLNRIKEAIEVWKAAEPVQLIKRVKEIQEESVAGAIRFKRAEAAREKVASDLAQRLKELRGASNQNDQQALEEWRRKKLEEAKKREATAKAKQDLKDDEALQVAEEMTNALERGWGSLLEEVGLSSVAEPPSATHQNGPTLQEPDIEDGIIPGRPVPPECHAEPHTDYGGAAVRWGLTHHKESAADCCQACLDQAQSAKRGEMKCNIWVYCPAERGCFSPDKYEHRHQECWLKQAVEPQLNFKGKYSQEYRKQHPAAPVVVPWVSGVTSE
eukprot:c23793_g1_i1 orf=122-1009(+)